MSNRTKLEQGRAAKAYEFVENGKKLPQNKSNEYKSYVKKLPMYIKANGLGSAIAFAFARGNSGGRPDPSNAWGLIYSQIETWLDEEWKQLTKVEGISNTLAHRLTLENSSTYRSATVETLALLT
ncbi:MAG: type III-B CRISPR module-associated protein Cmr5 [Bacteroidia bacterium]